MNKPIEAIKIDITKTPIVIREPVYREAKAQRLAILSVTDELPDQKEIASMPEIRTYHLRQIQSLKQPPQNFLIEQNDMGLYDKLVQIVNDDIQAVKNEAYDKGWEYGEWVGQQKAAKMIGKMPWYKKMFFRS